MSVSNTLNPNSLSAVKIIAVASGKGGVGKSTVTANLAVALKNLGKKVGIIDADIYGPSQVMLLGAKGLQHSVENQKIVPIEKHGIPFVSMASLMAEDQPVVWRAPMAVKMVQQFLLHVAWGELDYIFIDLPPGTGDIQLTLAQQAYLHGAIIVTTPQQVAVGVARKGLQMFQEVGVPILGVIENMQGFICENCNHTNHIFGQGGGVRLADEFKTSYFGGVPLDARIVESGDMGTPAVDLYPESSMAKSFVSVASCLEKSIAEQSKKMGNEIPAKLELSGDGRELHLQWLDGTEGRLDARSLRYACPCASCVNEDTGKRMIQLSDISLGLHVSNQEAVGRYGVSLGFSDQHKTGIYRFEDLKQMVIKSGSEEFDV